MVSSEGPEGRVYRGLAPWLAGNVLSVSLHMVLSMYVCVSVSKLPFFFFYKDTNHVVRAHPVASS